MDWVQWCEKIGLVGSVLLIVSSFFFFILKWVLEQFKVELTENRAERVKFLSILETHNHMIQDHNNRAIDFQNMVKEDHVKMIDNLQEITITLGRINGYKKD